jgi:hypothetical protein
MPSAAWHRSRSKGEHQCFVLGMELELEMEISWCWFLLFEYFSVGGDETGTMIFAIV